MSTTSNPKNWKAGTRVMFLAEPSNPSELLTQGKVYILNKNARVTDFGVMISFENDLGAQTEIVSPVLNLSFREVGIEEARREFSITLTLEDGLTVVTSYRSLPSAIHDYTQHVLAGHKVTLTNTI